MPNAPPVKHEAIEFKDIKDANSFEQEVKDKILHKFLLCNGCSCVVLQSKEAQLHKQKDGVVFMMSPALKLNNLDPELNSQLHFRGF